MSMRPLALTICALAVTAGLAGCGSGRSESTSTPAPPPGSSRPEGFPKGAGLTFDDVRSRYPTDLSLGIGASVMRRGANRVPFLILDKGAKPVRNAPVALYTVRPDGTGVRGPFAAREQPFGIAPRFLSDASRSARAQSRAFMVSTVPVTSSGQQGAFALVRMDGRLVATSPSPLGGPTKGAPPPDVGAKAPVIHTLTVRDVKKLGAITTRTPPDRDMLQTDFDKVVGKKPIVLIFATPALCQSRVCGPIVDVAEQVRSRFAGKVAFIHQEIYRANQPDKGLRPQLFKYRLQSEPWIFVIDRSGRISARIEGAVSVAELKALVEKVV